MALSTTARKYLEDALVALSKEGRAVQLFRADLYPPDGIHLLIDLGLEKMLVIEWVDHHGGDLKAFSRGERLAASYVRRPGAWDVDLQDTPSEVREIAWALCKTLAGAPLEEDLTGTSDQGTTRSPEQAEDLIPPLVSAMQEAVPQGLATFEVEGITSWRVEVVRPFRYWRLVCDIRLHSDHGQHLGFLVFPTDLQEDVYARTRHFDVVYYSDDVEVAKHHEVLYGQHAALIDAFVGWLMRWELRADLAWLDGS